jgi:transcriptional regulator with XRE-family HTH domain
MGRIGLRTARERQALSLRELEEIAHVKSNTISKIERGEAAPMPRTRRRLAKALGYRPDEIEWINVS